MPRINRALRGSEKDIGTNMSLFSQNEMIKVVSAKIILGKNFLREDFHRGNYSSPGNYFVTFHWGKFSPFIFESNHFLIFSIAFNIINQSIITTGTSVVSLVMGLPNVTVSMGGWNV